MENKQNSFLTLPGAIIIAAAIIAIALIMVNKPTPSPASDNIADTPQSIDINLEPVNAEDHIIGNPNATIKIVEYSDPSCAYCKIFNSTMTDIMAQYGADGKVAWVYRHYPLDQADSQGNIFHPNSGRESQALECAADIGGNEKFWEYEKTLYDVTPSVTSQTPQGMDPKELPNIAKTVGLDVTAFNACLDSGRTKAKVNAQATSGANARVNGTPTSFLVLGESVNKKALDYIEGALIKYRIPSDLISMGADKKIISMSGAMPKAMMSGLIDTLLQR